MVPLIILQQAPKLLRRQRPLVQCYAENRIYCSLPENDSSTYWIEEFSINRLDPEIFTYQESNGFALNLDVLLVMQTIFRDGEIMSSSITPVADRIF